VAPAEIRRAPKPGGSRENGGTNGGTGAMSWDVVMNSGYEWLISSTSSAAQGGGGNFKNGKPIGEVSWCDAKMAERTH